MVYGTHNYSYWGESKPTYNWGASHCSKWASGARKSENWYPSLGPCILSGWTLLWKCKLVPPKYVCWLIRPIKYRYIYYKPKWNQRPFQEPKLEVPTIYFRPKGYWIVNIPTNYGLKYGTVAPFEGPEIHIDQIGVLHYGGAPQL